MAVVNTTYNFNQPNMNLGECIGYGILGSLTGNMGMYGMGMYGGFGMGGSIFPMGTMMGGYGCGFGGYGIGGYTNQMAGMQLGNALSGIVLTCLTQAIGGGRGGSSSADVKTKTFEDYKNDAEDLVSDNDVKDAEKKLESAKTLATSIKNTKSRISTVSKSIEEYTNDLSTLESCNKTINDYKELKDKLLPDTPENEAHNKEIKAQLNEKETEYKKAEGEKAKILAKGDIKNELDSLKEELKSLQDKLDHDVEAVNKLGIKDLRAITNAISDTTEITDAAAKALEDAKTERNEKIEKKAKELKEADEAEAKKQTNRAKLEDDINKVDGSSASRTRASKVKEKYGGSKDYDENDLQGALAGYRKNPDESDTWAKILKDIITSKKVKINSGFKNVLKTIPEIKNDTECMKYLNE